MEKPKPRVLILADEVWQKFFADELKQVEILPAATVDECRQIFLTNPGSLAAVVIDGCVGNSWDPEALDLVREICATEFRGHVISITSYSVLQLQLKKAGCDSAVSKARLPKHLLEIL